MRVSMTAAFAPHAPYTVTDATLQRIRLLADELELALRRRAAVFLSVSLSLAAAPWADSAAPVTPRSASPRSTR